MASEERTRALVADAGFSDVRTEEVAVRFSFGEIEEYMRFVADTAGPIALVLHRLSEDEREAVKSQVVEALAPFAADAGYELPGVSLTAAAS